MTTFDTYARNCLVGAQVQLRDQGRAVFEVTGKTHVDPPDNVEVELLRDEFGEAQFKVGDLAGGESVHVVAS